MSILGYEVRRNAQAGWVARSMVPVVAILAGLALGGLLVNATGNSPIDAYRAMFDGALGTSYGIQATVQRALPLILCGLAVSVALRMQLWNIGGEGQLLAGAASATAIGFGFPGLPTVALILLMLLGAMLGGALWALVAALPRALIGLNEIIVTLFLNYIAIRLISYLVFGPWKDPGAIGFAYSRPVPARLGAIPGTQYSIGLVVLVVVLVGVWWLFNRTSWGFSVDVAGGNERASAYLRMGRTRRVLLVLGISGGIAGLAGGLQLMGVAGRLQPDLSAGYGYAGILVAFLAGRSVLGVVATGFLFAALIQGGFALQSTGVTSALSTVNQALVILLVLIGNAVVGYRLVRVRRDEPAMSSAEAPA